MEKERAIERVVKDFLDRKREHIHLKDRNVLVARDILRYNDVPVYAKSYLDLNIALQEASENLGTCVRLCSSDEWSAALSEVKKFDEIYGTKKADLFRNSIPEFSNSLIAFADNRYPEIASNLIESRIGNIDGGAVVIEHPIFEMRNGQNEITDAGRIYTLNSSNLPNIKGLDSENLSNGGLYVILRGGAIPVGSVFADTEIRLVDINKSIKSPKSYYARLSMETK